VVSVNRNVLTVAHGAMCPIQTTCDAPKMCKRAKEHHCPHEAARNEKGSDEKEGNCFGIAGIEKETKRDTRPAVTPASSTGAF
jgi:hypothetical protein